MMKTRMALFTVLVGVAAVFLYGCLANIAEPTPVNPMDPDNPDTDSVVPGRPSGLTAVVSDRLVALTWAMSDTTGIAEYAVYRWEVQADEPEEYDEIGTVATMEYEDSQVRNGIEYSYEISAVNRHGLEGATSYSMSATPRIFSVAINGGQAKTADRGVVLTMSASGVTELMMISNESDMSGAQWQPFQIAVSWEMPTGDGDKTVYASFRDVEDNESLVVSDDIELDTTASITSITEDTGGEIMRVGDTVHFTLDAGETDGNASVDIGSIGLGIVLHDDGTWGDETADDGLYERDFVIEAGSEVVSATVVGRFSDELGNGAEPLQATGTITIHESPTAVVAYAPVPISERRLALSWSRHNDYDFERYRLFRSDTPGVDTSPDRELVADISSQSETTYSDGNLEPETTYYYAVYVVDEIGLIAMSNEVIGATLANDLPDAVELYEPWAADSTSIMLSWAQSEAEDFASYELIAWEQDPPNPPMEDEKRLIARITSIGETFYTHESLIDTLVYWYEVSVVDSLRASSVSNTVSGTPRPKPWCPVFPEKTTVVLP
ncbi:fibronectin type III domain-containing protein, partial [bacterium]|nr:fibronectin type III domain-containing protein [bacterium]